MISAAQAVKNAETGHLPGCSMNMRLSCCLCRGDSRGKGCEPRMSQAGMHGTDQYCRRRESRKRPLKCWSHTVHGWPPASGERSTKRPPPPLYSDSHTGISESPATIWRDELWTDRLPDGNGGSTLPRLAYQASRPQHRIAGGGLQGRILTARDLIEAQERVLWYRFRKLPELLCLLVRDRSLHLFFHLDETLWMNGQGFYFLVEPLEISRL